ncbi:NnrS family protein [Litoreibacter albidus]|uniref:Uncharacterized protein involved in response to NO n=1 Tax=Litoreibacter albidus TaxID=670155 RepID=A0A1H2Y070_9RHOB|nr:NnrS family protein [Litoreibacter albidus]SDW98526.1 uncharacterized protein involved in response to NO [Litoreibacter albidus]
MKTTTAEQMRQWRGPAVLSFGFRPLFSLAALWAAVAMAMWIAMLSGLMELPTRFDPVTWHAHEFLFGYLSAVIAGFLLTAVPNWTGRLPVVGWSLAGLALLWVMGRVAIVMSAALPVWLVVAADICFLATLWGVVLREIVAGKNWRNLPVLGLVGVLIFANLVFHYEAAQGDYAAQGFGLRLGLSVALMLVCLIGGKIIPSFTRNWLTKRSATKLPTPPMQRFDKITLAATAASLLAWTAAPAHLLVGLALLAIAVLHFIRLARWQGTATSAEPLVWVLHLAYMFVPLGAALTAAAILVPDAVAQATALHVWTAGALGMMTLAVMTRASLGHSGRVLHADTATTFIYLSLVVSIMTRIAADYLPELRAELLTLSGLFWLGSFGGFALAYGPMLMRAKDEKPA